MNFFLIPIMAFQLTFFDPIFVDPARDTGLMSLEYSVETGIEAMDMFGLTLKTESLRYFGNDSVITPFYAVNEDYMIEFYIRWRGFRFGTGITAHRPEGAKIWELVDDGIYAYVLYDSRMHRATR